MSFPFKSTSRRFQLKESDDQRVRVLSGSHVSLGEQSKATVVTLLRTGSFFHADHGRFDVTRQLFDGFIKNFNDFTYGQDAQIDVMHDNTSTHATVAGTIKRLFVEGNRLRALVEWTKDGIKANRERGLKYLSADYWDNYVDNENQNEHGPLLAGAALVSRPHIKNMDPVQLFENDDEDAGFYIHPNFAKQLIEEAQNTMNEFLKQLKELLAKKKFADATVKQFTESFEAQAKNLGDDKKALKALLAQFTGLADSVEKQLKETGKPADAPVTMNITLGESENTGLSVDDVKKLMADEKVAEAKKLAEDKTSLAAKQKIFDDALDADKGLSDETKFSLKESVDGLITLNITDGQVKKLAENQIALGNKMEADKKLTGMGYQVQGRPTINVGGDQSHMQLQETMDKNLKSTGYFANKKIALKEDKDLDAFTLQMLALFDSVPINRQRMLSEHKMLSGDGTMNLDNPWFPVGFQRTVIRELFHDFNIMQLVQTLVDATQTQVTDIPYEVIDHSQFQGDGIVAEGQGIPFANAGFTKDHAYVLAMKLAIKVSNEVIHFTQASQVNWNAWAEDVSAVTRIMRVRITRRLANEIQRASDSHLAQAIANENVASQLDGSTSQFKTAQFPVVRPHQEMDMQGNVVGNPDDPIVVTLDGTEIKQWNGTGKQAAGTYYVLKNVNLGYIQFVSEAKTLTPVNPGAGDTCTISYSYATNIVKFDLNPAAGVDYEVHLNGLLRKIGDQKAMMSGTRWVMPEYLLMSPSLNNEVTKAKEFVSDNKRRGTDTDFSGDLETIKAIPSFGTNAPNLDLGGERIHMGVRNTTTYKIAKAFTVGQHFEAVDEEGQPTGQRVAYGEEYSAIKTPKPVQNRATGIIVYNSTTR